MVSAATNFSTAMVWRSSSSAISSSPAFIWSSVFFFLRSSSAASRSRRFCSNAASCLCSNSIAISAVNWPFACKLANSLSKATMISASFRSYSSFMLAIFKSVSFRAYSSVALSASSWAFFSESLLFWLASSIESSN